MSDLPSEPNTPPDMPDPAVTPSPEVDPASSPDEAPALPSLPGGDETGRPYA